MSELLRVRPADLKPGDHLAVYEHTKVHYPEKFDVVESVRIDVTVTYRHVDTLCESGGCEGCGGGEEDWTHYSDGAFAEVWKAES